MSERELIRILSQLFGTAAAARVASLGIGDDAAVLRGSARRTRDPRKGERLVWTVDVAVEGVHFDRRILSLPDVGARSFHAAVSDIAAMGARPIAALSALIVPTSLGARAVRGIARGQAEAARDLGCPVVGGNLSRGGELSVTTTVLGAAARPLTRAGARVGDEVWLIGDVGLAAAGLRFLSSARGGDHRRRRARTDGEAVAACVAAFRRPRALVREGLQLALRAHAAIDVSDGLAGDARHVADASGVRLVLEEVALRRALTPSLRRASELLGTEALELALRGGEDYALVATGAAARRPRCGRRIGRVERGSGVVLERADGARGPAGAGFDHFSGRMR